MFPILSVLTGVKDYIEIVHKLIESDSNNIINNYYDFGAIITYMVLSGKEFLMDFFRFNWLNFTSLPVLVPNIASSLISEISVLDDYFHNAFTFLETPISYGKQSGIILCVEKFAIGLVNSLFLFLPTSTAHIISLRRFFMQGLEAGYIAGLGTIAGNLVWIGSIVFGLRFIVIPWLSLDIFRYLLGFILLVKYMWDSYSEKKVVLEDLSKKKIFLLNFLLAFTEQTNIYPFVSNLSIGSDSTVLESFPTDSIFGFFSIHTFYLLGLFVGSFSLLQFTCWFLENPAFNFYMWLVSSFKVTTGVYSKVLNFGFLYLTMICAISNMAYFGLDYTLTNPLGFVHEDRLIDQKALLETSFLNTKASDRNTRRNRGRHGRRERWKRRVRRYRTFDAQLYDQGIYDLFTIEDLNYGFDRFWLRRKIRNHRVRFRFFPGPWMRSFKKQLARPRLESFMGPRVEFFRILFEQVYHPEFHEFKKRPGNLNEESNKKTLDTKIDKTQLLNRLNFSNSKYLWIPSDDVHKKIRKKGLILEHSALRKFVRKVNRRIQINKSSSISGTSFAETFGTPTGLSSLSGNQNRIYSKRWKQLFNKISHDVSLENKTLFFNQSFFKQNPSFDVGNFQKFESEKKLSKKDLQILRYKSFLMSENQNEKGHGQAENYKAFTLLHPLKFYLQKEKAFQKKLKFYGPNIYRSFGVENNSPYFRTMMRRFFYYYKPTLRWERTLHTATMRKARRKSSRIVRKRNDKALLISNFDELSTIKKQDNMKDSQKNMNTSSISEEKENFALTKPEIQKPTHFYSLVSKRASRYRYQIYKDVLEHWYYSPFNRLLLKFDVDSFIRRQPSSYFLTKKEEQLLHLRRFLLSEHYETLRWYTYMQHYNSMKARIGGTKSFASRMYSQQFQGTFKKIRHLFALTPSASENTILKFDQPLFNESKINDSRFLVHEELLADENIYSFNKNSKVETENPVVKNFASSSTLSDQVLDRKGRFEDQNSSAFFNQNLKAPLSLTDQSLEVTRQYISKSAPVRDEYIQKQISEKNSWELTKFLLKGQKFRGTNPVTNEESYLNQENRLMNGDANAPSGEEALFKDKLFLSSIQENLWVELLKKCQNQLYDQESLKSYLSHHFEKRQRQRKRQEKYLKQRLERFHNWFVQSKNPQSSPAFSANIPTSIQTALKESLLFQKDSPYFGSAKLKTNIRNNRPEIWNDLYSSKIQGNSKSEFILNALKTQMKQKEIQIDQINQDLKRSYFKNNPTFSKNSLNFQVMKQYLPIPTGKEEGKIQSLLKTTLTPFRKVWNFVLPQEKRGSNYVLKNQEIALTRRKKTRKTLKRLKNTKERKADKTLYPKFRQKLDLGNQENQNRIQSWKSWNFKRSAESNFYTKQFKRKRSRFRRTRRFRNRGPIKKRTLRDKLKRQFRFLKRYSRNADSEASSQSMKKMEIFQMITKRKNVNGQESPKNNEFLPRETKQRRTKSLKRRFWRKHKKPVYAQNKSKQRKRRRYTVSKLRQFTKELKRQQNMTQIQNWWWESFLPKFQANIDAEITAKTQQERKQKLDAFSNQEIFDFDSKNKESLQIGNYDYKPLAFPEAIRIYQNMKNSKSEKETKLQKSEAFQTNPVQYISENSSPKVTGEDANHPISNIEQNLLTSNSPSRQSKELGASSDRMPQTFLFNTNPMPFYAGWDESLRKFVVTNRLSNLFTGPEFSFEGTQTLNSASQSKQFLLDKGNEINSNRFTQQLSPLRGMNAATTLYWQVPFTTYDPDQFFALGMDGFSPIGWRKFHFRHTKQSIKPILIQTQTNIQSKNPAFQKEGLKYNIQQKIQKFDIRNKSDSLFAFQKNLKTQISRREQKRYKRVKKHPRPPVWFPSGPLTSQVLPVHYIYVFYKRARLPRDRYIRRRLRRNKETLKSNFRYSSIRESFTQTKDFTLRRRVKPRRKYHRKRHLNQTDEIFIKRRAFRSMENEAGSLLLNERRRPSQLEIAGDMGSRKDQEAQKAKKRRKVQTKQQSENIRVRQLRRRVQRQVIRPVWRYRPRAGGVTWPGDYLRLELVKAPLLNLPASSPESAASGASQGTTLPEKNQTTRSQRKLRKKKRRSIQEWQIQPKKYLLQKHNIKVLKKRLEKSQNSSKMFQKIQELQYLLKI